MLKHNLKHNIVQLHGLVYILVLPAIPKQSSTLSEGFVESLKHLRKPIVDNLVQTVEAVAFGLENEIRFIQRLRSEQRLAFARRCV